MKRLARLLAVLAANGPWYCSVCGAVYNSDAEGAAHFASAHPELL